MLGAPAPWLREEEGRCVKVTTTRGFLAGAS